MEKVVVPFGKPNAIQQEVLSAFRSGARFVAMVTGRQALALDTRIPTPAGWQTIADIQVGDMVFDETGQPTKVDWVSPVFHDSATYRVTFDDGSSVVTDAGHRWLSHTKKTRKALGEPWRVPHPPETVTTEEMRASLYAHGHHTPINPRTGRRREANHAVSVCAPVEYPEQSLPIDPYVLGVWLGDGARGSGQVCFGDAEIMDSVRERGYHVPGGSPDAGKRCWSRTVHGLLPQLRELGVLERKYIPEAYLIGSVAQREELLKGLMDTDGHCNEKGSAEFYSSNEELARQAMQLVTSLGYKARLKTKDARLNGVSYGDTYCVVFAATRPVFHLPRKRDRQKFGGRLERGFRYVHSVEPVPTVPVKCIGVESASEMFLCTESYIPTKNSGKSHLGARWLLSRVATGKGPNKLYLVLAPTYRMARVAERKLQEALMADLKLWNSVKYLKQPIPTYTFPNGAIIEVHSVDDPNSVRGITADDVWFDEAAMAPEEAFDILVPVLLASAGSLLLTTTPRGKHSWLYRRVALKAFKPGEPEHDPNLYDPTYVVVTGSTWDNVDNLSEAAVRALEEQYGAGSQYALQEIEGKFVSFDGLVFQWDEANNYVSVGALPQPKEFTYVVGGIDFGWEDPMVAVVLGYKDGVWWAVDGVYQSHLSLNDFATQLEALGARWGVETWYADSADPRSIADLYQRGLPVVAVKKPTIESSIRSLSTFVNRNRFKVSTNCYWLRDELQMYRYGEIGRNGNKAPIDKNNHGIDGTRYALANFEWLWANQVDYSVRDEQDVEEEDYDSNFGANWKRRRSQSWGPAGLAGR